MVVFSLSEPGEVIRALVTYTDWWQPASSSVMQVGRARRMQGVSDGIPWGLLESLDERSELCRRMQLVSDRDRHVLFLWYVRQLGADEIARTLGISRRQCFRVRGNAIRKIVDLGDPANAVA